VHESAEELVLRDQYRPDFVHPEESVPTGLHEAATTRDGSGVGPVTTYPWEERAEDCVRQVPS
jgi:hypothetical protein